ncbi:MAG: hypothetical protein WKG07_14085 [Hymenobacter sp.]
MKKGNQLSFSLNLALKGASFSLQQLPYLVISRRVVELIQVIAQRG